MVFILYLIPIHKFYSFISSLYMYKTRGQKDQYSCSLLIGDEAASFTKEEMQQGKHTDYEKQLHDEMLSRLENATPPIQPPEVEELPPPVSNGKYFIIYLIYFY